MATAVQTKFSRAWAMPSPQTFSIPPIRDFIARWVDGASIIVDPFARDSRIANHTNDLNPESSAEFHLDAAEYCAMLVGQRLLANVVLFDPPYSPRQIAECYQQIGRKATTADTQNAALYARVRKPLGELLKPGGIALSFGWNSSGFGKAWPTEEILLVAHGGAHNDTICVAQRKPIESPAPELWKDNP